MIFRRPNRRNVEANQPEDRSGRAAPSTQLRTTTRKHIGETLISEGFIELEHVEEALDVQEKRGGMIVEILVDLGYLDLKVFSDFLASQAGTPGINLSRYAVSKEICLLVPREFATTHEVFPIDEIRGLMTVGMACPLDTETIERLEKLTQLKVKALRCDPRDVRAAIERYYSDESGHEQEIQSDSGSVASDIRLRIVARLVNRFDELPTLSDTVEKVQRAIHSESSSSSDIAKIVAYDPPVAARLLKLANSSVYGFPSSVDSVRMAITLLGFKRTYLAVLSSSVIQILEASKHIDFREFWSSSTFCAIAAQKLAIACNLTKADSVFTAGLLHDIGRFALAEVTPRRYARIDGRLTGDAFIDAERDALGITHPEAGYFLASRWNFPPEIAEAIRYHQVPEHASQAKGTVNIVALASRMAEAYRQDSQSNEPFQDRCTWYSSALTLDSEAENQVYAESVLAMRNAMDYT